MNKRILVFTGLLISALLIVGLLHAGYYLVRNYDLDYKLFFLGYVINFAMALGIYSALLYFAERHNKHLGFLFMFGSTLKFIIYFLIFDPIFMVDGKLSKVEFFTFFIPYFTCLFVETFQLIKLMRELDQQ
ncbi:hypothetical protein [uncultured Eudoraea sp.]|uniref:hypothetical protein n=1 Tax=uncultured Eudoraea sp. TaxID=1035614 RepID=UPI0026052351|nr:hypothetical protein [uncultured Eudoraea sp.]